MLDTFFYVGTILALLFSIYGKTQLSAWGYTIAVALFIIMGISLMTTGWETYANATVTILDINADTSMITQGTLTYSPDLSGNSTEQIVYALGIFYVALGLIFTFLAASTAAANKSAIQE